MEDLLALILEWHMFLSNAADFCDKQSFSSSGTNASRNLDSKNVCPERTWEFPVSCYSFSLTAGSGECCIISYAWFTY